MRDGKIELGGLVSFIVLPARGLGYGLRINPIIEILRSALNRWCGINFESLTAPASFLDEVKRMIRDLK